MTKKLSHYWLSAISNEIKLSNYRAEYYGISTDGAHRALNDCRMNYLIFERLGREISDTPDKLRTCPRCGSLMQKRNGRYGEFWGCTSYPDCRYTENV